ncbi:MAG: hypothetical protein Q4A76_10050 [Porphyromonadaceae bacterium]|nr:hypothetical protein [Porphyromonadaceae bacterium]
MEQKNVETKETIKEKLENLKDDEVLVIDTNGNVKVQKSEE